MSLEYKGYEICSDQSFGMRVIKAIGSGTLPKILKGSFTNTGAAQKQVDFYLKNKKVKTNGKADSTS